MVVTALESVATVSETALTSALTAVTSGFDTEDAVLTVAVTEADFTGAFAFVGVT